MSGKNSRVYTTSKIKKTHQIKWWTPLEEDVRNTFAGCRQLLILVPRSPEMHSGHRRESQL